MMTSSLYWRPETNYGDPLPDELKFKLRDYFEDGHTISSLILSSSDIGYLRALDQCGVKGARKLITAIEKHGDIIIEERF